MPAQAALEQVSGSFVSLIIDAVSEPFLSLVQSGDNIVESLSLGSKGDLEGLEALALRPVKDPSHALCLAWPSFEPGICIWLSDAYLTLWNNHTSCTVT